MKCPKCQHDMELEEHYNYYINDTETAVEEQWWCPNCNNFPIRFVTYKQIQERWEDGNIP